MSKKVAVVGAGIMGLTAAQRLREAGFEVDIYFKEHPLETTSSVAAAFWYPYKVAPAGRANVWAAQTYQEYELQLSNQADGLAMLPFREFFREQAETPDWIDAVKDFYRLTSEEIRPGFKSGNGFSTIRIDTSFYLPHLIEQLESMDVVFIQREIESLSLLTAEYPMVVNCSGVGARELVADELVHPIRGQIRLGEALSKEDEAILVFREENHATYVVPRVQDCVLGGTAEVNDWERSPRAETAIEISRRCVDLNAEVSRLRILEDKVGLRPGRETVRLEVDTEKSGSFIVHNYGHGGAGFSLCWGCASEVALHAEELLC